MRPCSTGCAANRRYGSLNSSPRFLGEGDRAERGGGDLRTQQGPSTTLRVVPLPCKCRGGFRATLQRASTVSFALLRSTEFGPAEMVKVPGSTTFLISMFHKARSS